jgi:hypothetical protein
VDDVLVIAREQVVVNKGFTLLEPYAILAVGFLACMATA